MAADEQCSAVENLFYGAEYLLQPLFRPLRADKRVLNPRPRSLDRMASERLCPDTPLFSAGWDALLCVLFHFTFVQ